MENCGERFTYQQERVERWPEGISGGKQHFDFFAKEGVMSVLLP